MSTATELKTLGNQAFAEKKFEEAINFYTQAIEINSNDATYFSNRSGCYASLNKFEEALIDAEKCLSVDPKFMKGYSRKGLCLFKLGKEEEALEAYEAGLKIDPNNEQLLKDKSAIDQSSQQSMGDMMGLLQNPEIQKMMKENPQMLNTLLQNPNLFKDPAMMANMANLFGGMKNKGAKKPSEDVPSNNVPHESQSNPWVNSFPQQETEKKPQPKQESKPAQTSNAKSQSPFDLKKSQADTEYKARHFEESIALYSECAILQPDNLLVQNNKAACLIELKRFEEAEKVIDEAIQKYKELEFSQKSYQHLAKLLTRKGRIYHLQNKYAEAIKLYGDSLLEDNVPLVEEYRREAKVSLRKQEEKAYIDPALSEKHRETGNEFFNKGDFGNAIKEYEEAKKRNPSDAKVYNNVAMCFIKIMKFNEAMKEVEKAIELDPKFTKAYLRKANIHNLLKEHHKALDTFNNVLKSDPENAEAKNGLKETEMKISMSMHDGNDEERTKRAMNDPEIVSIMSDPMVRIALEQMQQNPRNAMEYMTDRALGPKIQKLIAAGIIKTK